METFTPPGNDVYLICFWTGQPLERRDVVKVYVGMELRVLVGYLDRGKMCFHSVSRQKLLWYKLKDKPGKDKKKDRGELEVKVAFIVKSGSLADLSKKEKNKSSLGSLAFSGSLISISSLDKRKGLKKLASKIGKKVKKNKNEEENEPAIQNLDLGISKQLPGEADPGVISEGESEDDFTDSRSEECEDVTPTMISRIEAFTKDKYDNNFKPNTVMFGEQNAEIEATQKNEKLPSVTPSIEISQAFEKVQNVGGNVSKKWMKAYRKIKIGHASIRMLDELSHKGSGCSLEVNPNATITSTVSSVFPICGSLENLGGGELLRRSSVTSLPTTTPPMKPPRTTCVVQSEKKLDEWEQKLYGKHGKEGGNGRKMETLKRRLSVLSLFTSVDERTPSPPESSNILEEIACHSKAPSPSPSYKELPEETKPSNSPSTFNRNTMERIIIGGETEKIPNINSSRLSSEILKKFEGKSREDLIEMVLELESKLNEKRNQQKDLEDYLDNLLLRVMETSPRILQNPYISCKTQAKIM